MTASLCGLHQWIPEDNFLRTDFNADFEKIDTALHAAQGTADGKTSIVVGCYYGNDEMHRYIDLGARPKAVYLERVFTHQDHPDDSGLAVDGMYSGSLESFPKVAVTDTGFEVGKNSQASTNNSGSIYNYIAFF